MSERYFTFLRLKGMRFFWRWQVFLLPMVVQLNEAPNPTEGQFGIELWQAVYFEGVVSRKAEANLLPLTLEQLDCLSAFCRRNKANQSGT